MEPIILASGSPRRQETLKTLGVPFQVIIPEIDENLSEGIELEKLPEYLAAKKVEYVSKMLPAKQEVPWILGADTIMIMDGKVYGKPADIDEAIKFLKEFSGKTHTVITSMALYNGKLKYLSTRTAQTKVTFADISQEEIDWYISTGEWHNVAGGYRIQGFGSYFIKKIEGTSSTVVGLPLFELYDMLKEQGYSLIGLE
ncbi:MAG: Maf family protein [Treponema sp.]|nr:septum formation protein Maf [Spirochaetaceae bacterium]MEE0133583.1 Maf family protein [Treponema sp.]